MADTTTWVMVPEDLLTHIHDWRKACEIALDQAPPSREDFDDIGYWRKQLSTLDQIEKDLAEHKGREKRAAYDKAWEGQIVGDMAREAAKNHDLWKLIEAYTNAALLFQHEIDNGDSRSDEHTARVEWVAARDALRKHIGLEVEDELPTYPRNGDLMPREYLLNVDN